MTGDVLYCDVTLPLSIYIGYSGCETLQFLRNCLFYQRSFLIFWTWFSEEHKDASDNSDTKFEQADGHEVHEAVRSLCSIQPKSTLN